jgi:S1-C subfamily serine protease
MDMEELNKSQIVMLTLLVSFVTSIATGIVTVSLMDQAPPTVTQTINRVVERTVERVVPQETQTATVITKERTVVVKESELIAQAVDRASPSFVSIYGITKDGEAGDFIARGVIAAPDLVITTVNSSDKNAEFLVKLSDGSVILGKTVAVDAVNSIAILKFKVDKEKAPKPSAFVTSQPSLGQTIVSLTGIDRVKIANGIVTGFISSESADVDPKNSTKTKIPEQTFETNINVNALVKGSIVINTDGAVIGMSQGNTSLGITPATALLMALADLGDKEKAGIDEIATTQ